MLYNAIRVYTAVAVLCTAIKLGLDATASITHGHWLLLVLVPVLVYGVHGLAVLVQDSLKYTVGLVVDACRVKAAAVYTYTAAARVLLEVALSYAAVVITSWAFNELTEIYPALDTAGAEYAVQMVAVAVMHAAWMIVVPPAVAGRQRHVLTRMSLFVVSIYTLTSRLTLMHILLGVHCCATLLARDWKLPHAHAL